MSLEIVSRTLTLQVDGWNTLNRIFTFYFTDINSIQSHIVSFSVAFQLNVKFVMAISILPCSRGSVKLGRERVATENLWISWYLLINFSIHYNHLVTCIPIFCHCYSLARWGYAESLTSLRTLCGGVGPVDLEVRLATMVDTARATEVNTNI